MPYPLRNQQQYDVVIDGKGYMLVRQDPDKGGGRSWLRRGTSDLPRRSFYFQEDRYGNQVDEVDHEEHWDDWSGGYGAAYRSGPEDTRYLFAWNFDARYPRQLIHAQALQLLPNAQYSGANVNVEYISDVPLPGVANAPPGTGAALVYGAGFVCSYTPTQLVNTIASAFTLKAEATGQQAQGRPAIFGSFCYIGAGAAGFYQRGFDGATYTFNNQLPAQGFANFRNVMWRRHSGHNLQSVSFGSDPMATANWGATLNLGNGLYQINDMMERGDALFVGMDDGLFQGDISGTFFNVLPEARNARHPDNGRDLSAFDGGIVFAGAPGVYWYQPAQFGGARGDAFEIGPQAVTSGRNPIRGRIRAQESCGPWTYALMFTGSESVVLSGRRDQTRQQPGPYVWHTMQKLPHVAKGHRIHFDGITNASGQYTEISTRMWVATEASYGAAQGTAPLYVASVPRLNQNPLTDTTFTGNYFGSARIDFPYTDWQMPGVYKIFRSVEVYADNLATGAQWCDVWCHIDNSSRMFIGRAQTSPKTTLYFPGDNGTFLSGIALRLSLESYTASSTITPVYRSVVVRGPVCPRPVDVVTAVVHIADRLQDRFGNEMRDGATMISELRRLADPLQQVQPPRPVLLQDLAGATQWVKVLPSLEEQELHQAGDRPLEVAATIRLACLDFTQASGDAPVVFFPFAAAGQLVG